MMCEGGARWGYDPVWQPKDFNDKWFCSDELQLTTLASKYNVLVDPTLIIIN